MTRYFLTAFFLLCLARPAFAEDNAVIGNIVEIEGTVSVAGAPAAIDAPIHENDVIQTGPQSRAFVLFIDETQLTLSENTKAKVDTYVFDPDNKKDNKARYSILDGTFLYLSGLIAKKPDPDVQVETPYASIGIRGTAFWGGKIDDAYGVLVTDGHVNVKTSAGEVGVDPGLGTSIATPQALPTPVKKWPQQKVSRATATVFLKRQDFVRRRIIEMRTRHQAMRARYRQHLREMREEREDRFHLRRRQSPEQAQ